MQPSNSARGRDWIPGGATSRVTAVESEASWVKKKKKSVLVIEIISTACTVKRFLKTVLHNMQGQSIYCYLSNIIIFPPTCMFSLFYLFGFCSLLLWPRRGQCCEYGVGSLAAALLLFTSLHATARPESGGHLFNRPILSPML